MESRTSACNQRSAAPPRAVLSLLVVVYTFGLAGVVSLLLSRSGGNGGRHPQVSRRTSIHHPTRAATPRQTPRARIRVVRRAPRVFVWSLPQPARARPHRLVQRPA